jgi:hypothetical protein
MDATTPVRRQIEVQAGASADRLVVDVQQCSRGLYLSILARMVEPARSD